MGAPPTVPTADPSAFGKWRRTPFAGSEALVDLIRSVADANGTTPAQVALGWILAQGPSNVPIPGTTKLHRLEENLAAANLALPAGQLTQLADAAAKVQILGERYSPQMLWMIDR